MAHTNPAVVRGDAGAFLGLVSRRRPRFIVAAIAGVVTVLAGGCGPTSFLVTPVPGDRALREHVVRREGLLAFHKVAVVDVEGVLRNSRPVSLLGGERDNPVVVFKEKLDRAAADARVRAVVVRINSPGGGVTASDLMYCELAAFRQRTRKPVVASLMDVAASGGYYLACAADEIHAQPTTVTGSIGVIMIAPDFSGTMDKLGIQANVIKSGPLKDAGSPLRSMTPEDRAVFQSMIDAMYERFLAVVTAGRKGVEPARLRELADGRVYLAPVARELGLIDEVSSLDGAIRRAKALAGLGDRPVLVVEYARSIDHRPNIYAESPAPGSVQVNLLNVTLPELLVSGAPEFLYVWAPGW
ncbi:MAG: signal peptide peptidase SppA [Phycisphaerae bacterium]|nr:signal peptide peptidase SppA [Phycisphaerae bacterium]MCZ2400815.1 signal peptide peptidase SppA [Phycisphaerae bacterium]NUQ48393.1 signal peptide peptidase SppA [Phycisphaerae bacterium]